MARRSRLDWRIVLAVACGLAALLVGIDLDFGFAVSVLLAVLVSAFVVAGLRVRRAPQAVSRGARQERAPRITVGHDVMTLREVGGGSTDVIPPGSRGRVTGNGWGTLTVAFTVYGPLGTRVVEVPVRPQDLRRL